MGDVSSPYIQPPPLPAQRNNMPMVYYGLVIIGTAAIVLAIYNLIIIRWCTHQHRQDHSSGQGPNRFVEVTTASQSSSNLLTSFKYKKDNLIAKDHGSSHYECAVCLSVFEDGEEVKKLPGCNHSFHASCIDMWLYSHYDCPLCRARVDPLPPSFYRRHSVPTASDNSQENLLGGNNHFLPLS
ncbi:RING-H2 finger protein ATL1 [Ricinus communis]|nr:RING-H2 finger protein ATL1 [Ricinus communis]|eukprot:XP_015571688.1 RING-H2 finger protein ATL1 [Ricinus communis]